MNEVRPLPLGRRHPQRERRHEQKLEGHRAGLGSASWLSKALQALGDHDSIDQGNEQGRGGPGLGW